MYYIKINGRIQPKKFNLISEAKAEIERLRQETIVNSWNILSEKSAALERKNNFSNWHMTTSEKIIILLLILLIAISSVFLYYRQPTKATSVHFVVPQMVNYRNKNGKILGQLTKGTEISCHKITKDRCQTVINGKAAYIYLNVLKEK